MEKVRISRNLQPGKYLIIALGLIFIIRLVIVISFPRKNVDEIIILLCFLLVSTWLYYLLDKAKAVAFDESCMFISNKGYNEVVPLTKVYEIKLTMTRINYDSFWKIKYIDAGGKESAARVLPRPKNFELFKEIVKETNPKVIVKNHSHNFDLDQ